MASADPTLPFNSSGRDASKCPNEIKGKFCDCGFCRPTAGKQLRAMLGFYYHNFLSKPVNETVGREGRGGELGGGKEG